MESIVILQKNNQDGGGWFKFYVNDLNSLEKFMKEGRAAARIDFLDRRLRSLDQIRKWWALLNDIWEFTGYTKLFLHDKFKETYSEVKGVDPSELSLRTIDMTTLKEMIDLVLNWCMSYDVPITHSTGLLFENDVKFLYYLFRKRRCFICGEKGDWHHIVGSKVGMGNNRSKINNVGREFLCLCSTHHVECEQKSEEVFILKNHLQPIKLTEEQVKELKL